MFEQYLLGAIVYRLDFVDDTYSLIMDKGCLQLFNPTKWCLNKNMIEAPLKGELCNAKIIEIIFSDKESLQIKFDNAYALWMNLSPSCYLTPEALCFTASDDTFSIVE